MYEQLEKQKVNKTKSIVNSIGQKKSNTRQDTGFVDNRDVSERVTLQYLRGPGTEGMQEVIQGKWHVEASCHVLNVETSARSQSSTPINWAVKLMEPAMTKVTNPLFQCAETKSLSAALRVYTPSKEYGISEEILEDIYWYNVQWYGQNEKGEDKKDKDGKSRKEGDQADPCKTCETWTEGNGGYLTIKEGALNLVRRDKDVKLYDKEHHRNAENKERDVKNIFNKKISFLQTFNRWPNHIEGHYDVLDDEMILVAAMDDDLYQKVKIADRNLGDYLKEKNMVEGKSTKSNELRGTLVVNMLNTWRAISKEIQEGVAEGLE
ncbi:MAG: hypothetical protein HRU19_32840 [Pseudobacteriovorax sp.]|nr:hypothetical protein [Pseudobacteriovorax sp.]